MIKRIIDVQGYWKVIVYFDIDYDLFNIVAKELEGVLCPKEEIKGIYYHMTTDAKAFTFSNIDLGISVVGFNKHKNRYDYIDSIVHESEHIKQAMLRAYKVNDSGEPPAYTIGYLVSQMLKINDILCLL